MVKLIILKKKNRYNNKKLSQLGKCSECILLASNPGIGTCCSGLCGEGCAHLIRQPGETAEGFLFLFFPCFPWSYGSSVTNGSSQVVSSDSWLGSSICFFLSTGKVAIQTSLCKVVQSVVFARWQLHFPIATTLFCLAPHATRWGNSVLCTTLSPKRLPQ
jgi:hypothetical protein